MNAPILYLSFDVFRFIWKCNFFIVFCRESGYLPLATALACYKCEDTNKNQWKINRAKWKKKGDKEQRKEGETYASGAF